MNDESLGIMCHKMHIFPSIMSIIIIQICHPILMSYYATLPTL